MRIRSLIITVLSVTLIGSSLMWLLTRREPLPYKLVEVTTVTPSMPVVQTDTTATQRFENFIPFLKSSPGTYRRTSSDLHPVVNIFNSLFSDAERQELLKNSDTKRTFEFINSPEFTRFLETDPTRRQMDEFWIEHGFPIDLNRHMKAFRRYFPTGEPKDYEPEMRQRLIQILKENPPDNIMNVIDDHFDKFYDSPRVKAWASGYFQGGDMAAWGVQIIMETVKPQDDAIQHAQKTTNEIQRTSFDIFQNTNREEQTPIAKRIPDGVENSKATRLPEKTNAPPYPVTKDPLDALEVPDIPVDESLEGQLREQLNLDRFSPHRLNTAVQTLNQYGSEQGLRRLKSFDPEIAHMVERFIHPQKEKD